MRVLIIEDQQALRESLAAQLRAEGFAVDASADGAEGLWYGEEYPIDVAVVDLGLPGLSGIEVIRRWRASGHGFPVLVLTAHGRWQDKVEGLEAGADDYVVKPVHGEELLARLRALVRRAGGWSQASIRCPPLELDPRAQRVTLSGEPLELTAFEYRILEHLMLRAGETVAKDELAEHIRDGDVDLESNSIEVLVGRLRRKLDPERKLHPIETLRARGYRLRLERDGA